MHKSNRAASLDSFGICGHSQNSSNLVGVARVKEVALIRSDGSAADGCNDRGIGRTTYVRLSR